MNRRTVILIVLLILFAAMAALILFWPTDILPRLPPYLRALVPALFGAIWIALAIFERLFKLIGVSLRDFARARPPTSHPPLTAVTIDRLLDDLTDDGQVLWLDRQVVSLDDLRAAGGRLILTGPFKAGKSREAIQLIERATAQGWVARDRIYEPHATFAQQTPAGLRTALSGCLDPRRPALVFVDDLPRYHSGDNLKLLDIVLDALRACPHGYFLATARTDELRDEHRAWLISRPEPIREIPLPTWQDDAKAELARRAASRSEVQLPPAAVPAFQAITEGAPEVIIQAIQQLSASDLPVDPPAVLEWARKSLVELWSDILLELRRTVPGSQHLFAALAVFRYASVSCSTPLVLDYAAYLWRRGKWWAPPWFARRRLRRALPRLRNFAVDDSGGFLRCDDAPLERLSTREEACPALQAFLLAHRRLFHNRVLRRLYPDAEPHAWAIFDLAHGAEDRTDHTGAIRLYTASLAVRPNPNAYNNRGNIRAAEGDRPGAIHDYTRAVELNPNFAGAYYNRGLSRAELGDRRGAMADYDRAIELDPSFAPAYSSRGMVRAKDGDSAAAIADYTRAIELDPNFATAYNNRGVDRLEAGDRPGALSDYTRVIELDPNHATAHSNRGKVLRDMGRLEESLSDLDRAIALDDHISRAIGSRGETYRQMGRCDEALADFDRAITLDGSYGWALGRRGAVRGQLGNYDGALSDLGHAIALSDQYAWTLALRGEIYRHMGRYEEALADLDRAIALDDRYAWALALRGQIYHAMGRQDEARSDLDRAAALDPSCRTFARADPNPPIRNELYFQALIADPAQR